MSRNVKKYFRVRAGHVLLDSTDEEEFLGRRSKNQKGRNTNHRNRFRTTLKRNRRREKLYERDCDENLPREIDIFKGMVRNKIGEYSAEVKFLVLKLMSEVADVKKKFLNNLIDELNRWEKYNDCLKYEEDKVIELFEKLKNKNYLMRTEHNKFKRIYEMHKNFVKEHGEVMNKYEVEVEALKRATVNGISDIKKK